jgi:aspartate/methionine/tyrosine aminotransferase
MLFRALGGSVGAYTDSRGVLGIREEVAKFIVQRDGCGPVTADDVFVTNGASNGVCRVLTVLLRNPRDAVLVPIPQYPLYSASVALHDGTLLPYSLDEAAGWAVRRNLSCASASS